jgi:uncharacterized protein YbjT (DUF2867 family)
MKAVDVVDVSKGVIMKVAIIGGTGLIGSKVATGLREHGHDAVAVSASTGVNSVTGEGLTEAIQGASVVVDVTDSPIKEAAAALNFFDTSTRNLLEAEAAAGVGHHVALSIVGTDRAPDNPYYRAKLTQEELIASSSIPYSIIHATQFFEFVNIIAQVATDGDTVRLPPVLVQPIAADEVAIAVGKVAVGVPLNGHMEIAGPESFRLDELVEHALTARLDPRKVIADPQALYFGAHLSERTLVPDDGVAQLGTTRFDDWLNQSISASTR